MVGLAETIENNKLIAEFMDDSKGFFEFGGINDNEWCKELSISFNFLLIRINYTIWWNFYNS